MRCDYFDAGVCRSCQLLEIRYADQLTRKQARVAAALAPVAPGLAWLPAVASAEAGFRTKAKMVAGGTVVAPTLGILSPSGEGVDLLGCGLHSPGLQAALPVLRSFVTEAGLTPYSVPRRHGELKHVIATEAASGELMVRWVLRSTEALSRLRKHLPALRERLPIAVASVNLQPEHKAVLEGDEEIVLTEQGSLTMRVNEIELHLRPQSFFQTNTEVAAALYRHARALAAEIAPTTVWDLYCGVGGFGLHLAGPGRTVVGVESSAQAIASARLSAADLGLADSTTWIAGDATAYALAASGETPELVVVNPPRRGIGPRLAGWLEAADVEHVVYSSCNVDSLARDLAAMPSLRPVSARLLDMFPHTEHHEVLVLLERG
jgi:23S rRNA (uracil747-C5)-methyltransferase